MSFEEYYNSLNSEIAEYFNIIYPTFPTFLIPFIESKSFARLNKVSYFCGAEQGSKSVYNFKYSISRLDHSISTALHVWAKTFDYYSSLAALFHDVTTPALSHVIDYLNKDYLKQESTELDIEKYLMKNDPKLLNFMKSYKLDIDRIFNYKYNSLIDLDRPKLCADRIDFIFLTNLAWTRNITIDEIKDLYNHLYLEINEDGVMEFAVDDYEAEKQKGQYSFYTIYAWRIYSLYGSLWLNEKNRVKSQFYHRSICGDTDSNDDNSGNDKPDI